MTFEVDADGIRRPVSAACTGRRSWDCTACNRQVEVQNFPTGPPSLTHAEIEELRVRAERMDRAERRNAAARALPLPSSLRQRILHAAF